MIKIFILSSTSPEFPSVNYSYKKIQRERGELTSIVNFPSDITLDASPNQVRAYLKKVSKRSISKKPQIHIAISTRFQNEGKALLTEKAKDFMEKFGYGKQPYITIFHDDTENSHLHIVSTRIDVESGRKIPDFHELFRVLKIQLDWEDETRSIPIREELNDLLSYSFPSLDALNVLLLEKKYKIVSSRKHPGKTFLNYRGFRIREIEESSLKFKESANKERLMAISGILEYESKNSSSKVFATYDQRKYQKVPGDKAGIRHGFPENLVFRSELQKELDKKHGINIVFKDTEKNSKTYVIDRDTKSVYEGEDAQQFRSYFEFTVEKINIEHFLRANDYTIESPRAKELLLKFYDIPELKDYMVFSSTIDKRSDVFRDIQKDVSAHIMDLKNPHIKFVLTREGEAVAWHGRYHHLQDVKSLVSPSTFKVFERKWLNEVVNTASNLKVGQQISKKASEREKNPILYNDKNIDVKRFSYLRR